MTNTDIVRRHDKPGVGEFLVLSHEDLPYGGITFDSTIQTDTGNRYAFDPEFDTFNLVGVRNPNSSLSYTRGSDNNSVLVTWTLNGEDEKTFTIKFKEQIPLDGNDDTNGELSEAVAGLLGIMLDSPVIYVGTGENDNLSSLEEYDPLFDGDDVILGNGGNDELFGREGNDYIEDGGAGVGNPPIVHPTSGASIDHVDDVLDGGSGNDILIGDDDKDYMVGGTGNDTIYGGKGFDSLYGDNPQEGAGNADSLPGDGADLFIFDVNSGNDTIYDFNIEEGDSIGLMGLIDKDSLEVNLVEGNKYNISWGEGGITLTFEGIEINEGEIKDAINPTIIGTLEKHKDYHKIYNFEDKYYKDDDYIIGNPVKDDLIIDGKGDDWLDGGLAGNDMLIGGEGNDILIGRDGNDTLFGGSGDDTIRGGSGSDILYGGADNDHLGGGAGDDEMYGGTGDDTFVFAIRHGNDTIMDFVDDMDTIRLVGITKSNFDDNVEITDAGLGNTLVTWGNNIDVVGSGSILLMAVDHTTIDEDDFIFG